MRQEIGSEFWSVPIAQTNNVFPADTQWFLSGRSALQAIIKEIKKARTIHTVAVPDWCCDSMIIPFVDAGMDVTFYPAMTHLDRPKTDVVLIMDYFGFTGHSGVNDYDGIVIRDVTHSLFSKSYNDADYFFGSLRKWAGFWTGGYARGFKEPIEYEEDSTNYISLRKEAMQLKADYIAEKSDSKDYLCIFEKAEVELEKIGIIRANLEDIEKAKILDVDFIRRKRRENAQILIDEFKNIVIFPELQDSDSPMFVPIRVQNRNELRKYLIQREIFCPVHWPVRDLHQLNDDTKKLYDEELSLICDQRYNKNNMVRIIKAIKEFYGKEGNCGIKNI